MFTLGVVAVAVLLATSSFAANRGVSFTPIGFIENPGDYPASTVYSMNPSGTVFMANPSAYGNYCVKWTREGGWGEEVGEAGGVCFIADDGTIAGDGANYDIMDYWPGYWLGAVNQWDFVPDAGGDNCGSTISTHGASDNLEYLVGLAWEGCKGRRFLYTKETDTSVWLPCMDEESCRLNDITNDGSKAVGWNTALCGGWRGAKTEGDSYDWIDGLGALNPKLCPSGDSCCGNYDCDEFVDDSSCSNVGACDTTGIDCVGGICTGGPNAGMTCSGYWNCPGECSDAANNPGTPCTGDWACEGTCVGGANDGDPCTGDYYCPDTDVCLANPDYDPMVLEYYKGEGYKVTPDGAYTLGYEFGQSPYDWSDPLYDWTLYSSAYRENPDGSFTKIPPPDNGYEGDSWTPLAISDNGDMVIGRFGWWIYAFPTFWTPYTGTQDLQYFLAAQGLDEIWFWTLDSANAVSADGRTIAGYGTNTTNPDCPLTWGCTEGWIVDMAKVKVCHMPGGDPDKARTLTIALESAGDHVAHGDFLGTCDFYFSQGGGRSIDDLRPQRPGTNSPDANPFLRSRDEAMQTQEAFAPAASAEQTQIERTPARVRKSR
jgi:hypothetical protein